MPRTGRIVSESGIYHIMARGINREPIFLDDSDHNNFLNILYKYKDICGFDLYAYSLMKNHFHLLLRVGEESVGNVMRRILVSYVSRFNKKYDRTGHLFQGRYKSEPIEDDSYFLIVLKYILRNPVEANIVGKIEDYKWTNYKSYTSKIIFPDIEYVLRMFSYDKKRAVKDFIKFVNEDFLPLEIIEI